MKRTVSLIAAFIILLLLAGCGKYTSSYKAVGFVHTNNPSSAAMSFLSFEGRMVFRLKSSGEGDLKYKARLGSGTATVCYEYRGIRSELFSIGPGEEIDSRGGYIESGTVYIIMETDGKCADGEFSIRTE